MKKRLLALVTVCACFALALVCLSGCGGSSAKYKVIETIQEEHYAVAFKLGDDNLAAVVTATMAELDKEGVVKEIAERYADEGADYANWILEAPKEAGDASAIPAGFTLKLGFDAAYPPYGFIADDGTYAGFDIDLAKAVCEKLGWSLQLQAIDWDAKDALLDSGTINCIWNGLTAEGREDKYALSGYYMLNKQVVVVKGDSSAKSLADLAGKTVCTQSGSAAFDLLTGEDFADITATFASLDAVPDYQTAFMNLDSGACDAIVCDSSMADAQIAAKK